MQTYQEVMGAYEVEIPEHLAADAEIPVVSGLQMQGDVAIIPTRLGKGTRVVVPADGVAVVRGEAGGNTHLLVGEGIEWQAASARAGLLELGIVNVPKGRVAYLLHPEHGAMGMAPGAYRIRRQREQADEIRRVAD